MRLRTKAFRAGLWTTAAMAPLAVSGACYAADAQPAAPGTPSSTTIQEVVVTSTKRSENLLKVPLSVTAVTQQSMDQQGIRTINDLVQTVPGINLIGGAGPTGAVKVNIRGISSGAGAATTGVYLDETPIEGRETGTVFPKIFDLDRVEVLRGPQGTLFGAGSEGGTVRFITPAPSLTNYSVYARSELAFTEGGSPSAEAGVTAGGPIVEDKLGFRASIWTRHDGGWVDRYNFFTGEPAGKDINDQDSYAGKVALLYQPIAALQITPSLYYQKTNSADAATWWNGLGTDKTWFNLPQPTREEFYLPSLTASYDFNHLNVKSISSFYNRTEDGINQFWHSSKQQIFYSQVPDYSDADQIVRTQKNFTQEVRFTTSDLGPFSFVGGLFYEHDQESYDEKEFEPLGDQLWVALTGKTIGQAFGVPLLPNFDSYHDHRSDLEEEIAGFAEASYDITQRLKLTAGVRYSQAKFSFNEFSEGPFGVGGNLKPVVSAGQSTDHPVNPKFNLSYSTDGGVIYAQAAKGYRIGGANAVLPNICAAQLASLGVSGTAPPYQSDSVWSYEAGAKQRFLDSRAEVEASVFKIDWTRIQGVIPLNTCALSYTGNFGAATSQGFDLQGQLRPIAGLTIDGSMSYTDAHYTQTVYVPNSKSQLLAKSGDPLLGTPKWQGHAGAQYNWMLLGLIDAYARVDVNYQSAVFNTYSQGVNGYIPLIHEGHPYTVSNLRFGVRKNGIDASLFVDNVGNNQTPIFETVNNNGGFAATPAAERFTSLRPQTFGVTVAYRY